MGRGLGIDLHPHPMDGDVVVIPTKRDEVVGVMAPTPGTGMDVVDLEPVTGTTALDRTLAGSKIASALSASQ